MIDFELTEDHQALVQTVREFAQKEVAPFIKEWDEKQYFEPTITKKMADLNLDAFLYPLQKILVAPITADETNSR